MDTTKLVGQSLQQTKTTHQKLLHEQEKRSQVGLRFWLDKEQIIENTFQTSCNKNYIWLTKRSKDKSLATRKCRHLHINKSLTDANCDWVSEAVKLIIFLVDF